VSSSGPSRLQAIPTRFLATIECCYRAEEGMVSQEELDNASWRKSSRSDSSGGCVSMAAMGPYCAIRDSKDASGPMIIFSKASLCTFFRAIKEGNFD
jgi:hypothetical protein